MHEKNADDLLRLADILGERFSGREEFSAYTALLQHFRGKINDFESIQKAAEQCIALHEKLETLGICSKRTLQREFIFQRCMADNDASELIMPDGTLGKCEHFNVEDSYGSIYTSERNEAILRAWKEWEYYPECDGCALYPQCFNLKKCEWLQDGCQRASRLVMLHNLERQILTAYQDYLMSTEQVPLFPAALSNKSKASKAAKAHAESCGGSAPQLTWQSHAQPSPAASPSLNPCRICVWRD